MDSIYEGLSKLKQNVKLLEEAFYQQDMGEYKRILDDMKQEIKHLRAAAFLKSLD